MKLILLCAALLVPFPAISADVTAAFSPGSGQDTAEQLVLDTVAGAKKSIRLAAYSFTSKPIAAALVKAHRRGVDVQAVLDKSNLKGKYSGAQFLANAGVPVRIDSRYAIMHNKFMVVDGETVETGSFNYTQAAAKSNAENAIVIRGDVALARQYSTEWGRLWAESEPLQARY